MKNNPMENIHKDFDHIDWDGMIKKHKFSIHDYHCFLSCCSILTANGRVLTCIESCKKAFEYYGFTVVMDDDGVNWRVS